MITMLVGLALTIASPVIADTGDLKTTNATGVEVNGNVFYPNKLAVYIGGNNFPQGHYWVKVTTPGGDILGKTVTASLAVGSDGKFVGPGGKDYVQLWDILYRTTGGFTLKGYDNTTNNGGEYKVWVSTDPAFPAGGHKSDNFKVGPVLGTIVVSKNTIGGNGVFNFAGTGGNGLPTSFSITTLANTGMVIYDVTPGTFGITEVASSNWTLTSSNIIPSTVVSGGIFTVASSATVTATFNNKKKLVSTTSTNLAAVTMNLGESVTDTATVIGTGSTPTGTVTFEVSTDNGATFAPYGAVKTLLNGSATSDPYTPAGGSVNYRFRALYSGDANYEASQSGDQEEPLTVVDEATIIVVKNTDAGDAVFSFTTTGGNGLPASFSITTSNNTKSITYKVPSGTYGIDETKESGWKLFNSTIVPVSAGSPGLFTLASGDTVTVTFNNSALPSEPVPELPSILLFGLGLLSVAGFVAKKKLSKVAAGK
jgi:hypothetical protein